MPSMAFAKSTQARPSIFPLSRESLTTLQTSLHAADRPIAPPGLDPASTPASQPDPEASLLGTLVLPRPSSHRLAFESLGYGMTAPLHSSVAELLDACGHRLKPLRAG